LKKGSATNQEPKENEGKKFGKIHVPPSKQTENTAKADREKKPKGKKRVFNHSKIAGAGEKKSLPTKYQRKSTPLKILEKNQSGRKSRKKKQLLEIKKKGKGQEKKKHIVIDFEPYPSYRRGIAYKLWGANIKRRLRGERKGERLKTSRMELSTSKKTFTI